MRKAQASHQISLAQYEVDMIFGNLEEILAINKQLLYELEYRARVSQAPAVHIARIFRDMAPALAGPYIKYSAHCAVAMQKLASYAKDNGTNIRSWMKVRNIHKASIF
jgi:hypothetical protein